MAADSAPDQETPDAEPPGVTVQHVEPSIAEPSPGTPRGTVLDELLSGVGPQPGELPVEKHAALKILAGVALPMTVGAAIIAGVLAVSTSPCAVAFATDLWRGATGQPSHESRYYCPEGWGG